jgi:two-component system OmpR family response regulator
VLLFPARRFLLEQGERPRPRGAPGLPLLLAYGEARLLGPCFLAGCDDYLREPWDPEELGWRLERRLAADARGYRLPWGGLVLRGLSLSGPGGRCALSYPEARILRLLLQSRAVPVPREALYYAIWGRGSGGRSRVVDVHVSKVRRKLLRLAPGSAGGIRAVRGVGYLMG